MQIAVHIPDTDRLGDSWITSDLPIIDLEAIIDHICNEYMFGTRRIDNVLLDCLDSLSSVSDCDHCEVSYNKLVSEIHNLIIKVYQQLDEHRLRDYSLGEFKRFRLKKRWRDLYVFELK